MAYARRIKLFGEDYILIGTLEAGGVIGTEEQYSNFDCSYAYLRSDGKIMRFGQEIGSRDDINLTSIEVKIEPNKVGLSKLCALLFPDYDLPNGHSEGRTK